MATEFSSLGPFYTDSRIVRHALRVAGEAHQGQFRISGEPSITHPIAVASMLADHGADHDVIAAGVLHDVLEDTELCLGEIRHTFGHRVADIVLLMSKPSSDAQPPVMAALQADPREQRFSTLFLHALCVKFYDRIHNLRTSAALPRDRQQRMAIETIEVIYPAAVHIDIRIAETLRRLSQTVLLGRFDDGHQRIARFTLEPEDRLIH